LIEITGKGATTTLRHADGGGVMLGRWTFGAAAQAARGCFEYCLIDTTIDVNGGQSMQA